MKNDSISWNLSAVVTGVTAMFVSWSPAPTATSIVQPDAPIQETFNNELPTHGGVASFPTGIWDDPFRYRELASEQLSRQGDNRDYQIEFDRFDRVPNRLMVMPVIVRGEHYHEEVSERINYRHAVENALNLNGFSMQFPDRMSYVSAGTIRCQSKGGPIEFRDGVAPIKLYASENGEGIVVLWIDRRWLGTSPLDVIHQVIKSTIGERCHAITSIIGPIYSEDLEKIYKERFAGGAAERLRLYSPTATNFEHNNAPPVPKMRFLSTIGANQSLVASMVAELERRRLLNGKVVLFYEGGYESPKGLRKQLEEALGGEGEEAKGNVISIPYPTGIGGASSAKSSDVFDYFSRNVRERTRRFNKIQPAQINLVGVLGNNAPDKLVVLESASAVFPNATFFTFDMDARYAESRNLRFTRNLLVASHFGLRVHLKKRRPPTTDDKAAEAKYLDPVMFRDGYQTSVYLAAHLAIAEFCDPSRVTPRLWHCDALKPLVFEVGADGLHEYDSPSKGVEGIENKSTATIRRGRLIGPLIVMLVGGLLLFLALRPLLGRHLHSSGGRLTICAWRLELYYALVMTCTYWCAPSSVPWPYFVANLAFGACLFVYICCSRERGDAARAAWPCAAWIRQLIEWERRVAQQRYRLSPSVVFFGVGLIIAGIALLDDSEPWGPLSGVSIWPSILIMALVCFGAIMVLNRMEPEEAPSMAQGSFESFRDWWKAYVRQPHVNARIISGILLAAVLVAGAVRGTTINSAPTRGQWSLYLGFFLQVLSMILLFLISSYATINSLSLRQRLAGYRRREARGSEFVESVFTSRAFDDWVELIRNVESLTKAASKAIWTAACLFLLYTVARLPFWDGWHVNAVLAQLMLLPLVIGLLLAWWVRLEARALKREALIGVRDAKRTALHLRQAGVDYPVSTDVIDNVEQEIIATRRGAFGDFAHDPVFGSAILVLTSAFAGPGQQMADYLRNISGM